MPKLLQYTADSVIYFQGDNNAEKIYLLQSGVVSLTYMDIETKKDVGETLNKGEFFGVKSALGHYPREENAIVLQASAVLAFTVPEFEQFAMKNGNLIMRMLKVFSNQMRRTHKQVATLMNSTESTQLDSEDGLYHLGKYYFKNRKYAYARHIFDKYLRYYPKGSYADEVQADFNAVIGYIARYGDGLIRISDDSGDAAGEEEAATVDTPETADGAEIGADESGGAADEELSENGKTYYAALSLISQGKYMQAFPALKKIADAADADFSPKSAFEIGRSLFLMGKYAESIQYYTQMITKYPKHDALGEALFYMGQSHEKTDGKAQAVGFYKKAIAIIKDEDNIITMKAQKALKGLEE
jgi:TolA-binding protein